MSVPELNVIPLRECTPWCTYGDGHPSAHPEDRICWSTSVELVLTEMKAVRWADGEWGYDNVEAFIWRLPESDAPLVVINHEGQSELRFTLEEAEALVRTLDGLIRTASGTVAPSAT